MGLKFWGSHQLADDTLARTGVRSIRAIEALNFVAADIPNAFGPFLALYLAKGLHWNPALIGVALAAQTLSAMLSQIPLNSGTDYVRRKKWLLWTALSVSAIGLLCILFIHSFWVIFVIQVLVGISWVIYQPTIFSISLGAVGTSALPKQLGRNEAFNHAGNVCSALLAGTLAQLFHIKAMFWLLLGQCLLGSCLVSLIRQHEIEKHLPTENLEERQLNLAHILQDLLSGVFRLFKHRPTQAFMASALLFHMSNAAMLPLISQHLMELQPHHASIGAALCIIVAQLVMIPSALWTSRYVPQCGIKPIFAIGFIILAIRGILYTLSDNVYYLISVQTLDGLAAGISGVMVGVVASEIAKETGRFNALVGLLITGIGLGATASNLIAGYVASQFGFQGAFLTLSAIALAGLWFFLSNMPELELKKSLPLDT